MDKNGYIPRGQFEPNYMEKAPNYSEIIKYANNPNNGLDIQFRGNYINIYYLGGSLLKLEGRNSFTFDENYFYRFSGDGLRITDIDKRLLKPDYIKRCRGSKRFLSKCSDEELEAYHLLSVKIKKELRQKKDNIIKRLKEARGKEVGVVLEDMKSVMRDYKDNLSNTNIRKSNINERVIQHYISLFNKEKESHSDFAVIDLEYELSEYASYRVPEEKKTKKGKKQPRIDIVAIEKKTGQLYVMELKYGMESTSGDAGIDVHFTDYLNSVGDDTKWRSFWEDINILYNSQ